MEALIKIITSGNPKNLIIILVIIIAIAIITYFALSDINDGEEK